MVPNVVGYLKREREGDKDEIASNQVLIKIVVQLRYLLNVRVQTEYILVKSVDPKVLWAESQVQGTGEYFPPLQSQSKIVMVEIGGVAIYRPFKEFRRANSYCHLYGAQGLVQRQAYF
ncbi:uncharacterized protein TNCV_1029971 [Trichonephila clavipes]|nr:uncharacterized protein TNCV_1029971 [Trichonephila clavipes]